jgi:hypothetical protein
MFYLHSKVQAVSNVFYCNSQLHNNIQIKSFYGHPVKIRLAPVTMNEKRERKTIQKKEQIIAV